MSKWLKYIAEVIGGCALEPSRMGIRSLGKRLQDNDMDNLTDWPPLTVTPESSPDTSSGGLSSPVTSSTPSSVPSPPATLSSAVFSNVESLAPPISKRISTAVRPSSLALPLPIPLSVSFRSAFLSHLLNYILKQIKSSKLKLPFYFILTMCQLHSAIVLFSCQSCAFIFFVDEPSIQEALMRLVEVYVIISEKKNSQKPS